MEKVNLKFKLKKIKANQNQEVKMVINNEKL